MEIDYEVFDPYSIVRVHQYTTIVRGFEFWNTRNKSQVDENGKFNRYIEWGPFAELVRVLEEMNLMDNKIAVEYDNGVFIGFYDGVVTVGASCWHPGATYIVECEEIRKRAFEASARKLSKIECKD